MVDKDTIMQVICGLMKHPQYLSETDKYRLTPDDFSSLFEKYIFSAIYNLYKDGATSITVFDIDNYLTTHKEAKACFEKNNGIEYLQDVLDFSQAENFPFYYKRLKKFNLLKELQREGYDTSKLYCEDYSNHKAKDINDKFEEYEIAQILDVIRRGILKIETEFTIGDASETNAATKDVFKLVKDLQKKPEIGAPLQGDIFNTVSRGARRTKFYIRSASSGTGKTRAALGDACALAYPLRFNPQNWRWEWTGSNERTLFIATEQELSEIQTLVLAYLTGFNEEKILYGRYDEKEYKVVLSAIKVMEFFKNNFYIVRLSNPNIEQIKAVIRQNWMLYDIKNVFYDYIFSSPSLLNEFRDLHIREDVALGMLSTALKDVAVEMNLFIMSSTQTNAKAEEDNRLMKNETVIRGSRAIIDKCDLACVISRVTKEELEVLEGITNEIGAVPNQVMDIYKVRRGRYTNVRIWSIVDLGTCRKEDLFITDDRLNLIDIEILGIDFENRKDEDLILDIMNKLNDDKEVEELIKEVESAEKVEEVLTLEEITEEDKEQRGFFGDLL